MLSLPIWLAKKKYIWFYQATIPYEKNFGCKVSETKISVTIMWSTCQAECLLFMKPITPGLWLATTSHFICLCVYIFESNDIKKNKITVIHSCFNSRRIEIELNWIEFEITRWIFGKKIKTNEHISTLKHRHSVYAQMKWWVKVSGNFNDEWSNRSFFAEKKINKFENY